ncbi:glycosyltransferase family 4 protein [Paenibacillus xerothermodurans]|uniref:Glycosyltransferase n=1 Tax=Paenibacillus xerothermodurans TaxID=1977292 RepID=A0A2W1NA14_PAEXE|nr:glycosyltransferase family 4 protein [Paenibacillus xerothermodurans]PZE21489.1 glycosyltransferase [Paenibacillus xerothermodurans]
MKILVIWRLLTVGGVNAGWRNRAIYFAKHNVKTEFLYLRDKGGRHMLKDVARVHLTRNSNRIVRIIRRNKYDAIIVVDSSQVYHLIKRAGYKGKLIIEARSPERHKIRPHLRNFKGLRPKAVIVPSAFQKRVVASVLKRRLPIRVIYNPINDQLFRPIKDKGQIQRAFHSLPNNKKIIGWIGRLDSRKNWRMLLKVAKAMAARRSDVCFAVIGGKASKERRQFKAQVKRYNLNQVVHWFPSIPYQKMPLMYSKIAESGGCTLSTTKMESFGNTFIEAMACGCPVVAPGASSLPELIDHNRNGKLYQPNSVTKAVKHLEAMLNNHATRKKIRKNGLRVVKRRFSPGVCARQHLRVIRAVIRNRPRRSIRRGKKVR